MQLLSDALSVRVRSEWEAVAFIILRRHFKHLKHYNEKSQTNATTAINANCMCQICILVKEVVDDLSVRVRSEGEAVVLKTGKWRLAISGRVDSNSKVRGLTEREIWNKFF